MAERLKQVLDECVSLVLRGVSVRECLARYPEYAAELEQELLAITRVAAHYNREPSPAAFARSRQRLQAQLAALEQQAFRSDARSRSWGSRLSAWLGVGARRWAVAAASLVLVVLVAGSGTVAASTGAIPGDALYPVKQGAERTLLAFALSDTARADRHLAYAERRAGEIAALLERGRPAEVGETSTRLAHHLAQAGRIGAGMGLQEALALRTRIEISAAAVLAGLEQAAARARGEDRPAAHAAVTTAGSGYAEASESMSARTGEQEVAAAPGTVQFRAVDPPPPGVSAVLLRLEAIEAYRAGEEGRWKTVVDSPRTFDLLRIVDTHEVLGEAEVAAGSYTRVRFQLTAVTVVMDTGQELSALPEPRSVELLRPFRVMEGQTTVVFLYFDGERSLLAGPDGTFGFSPEVLLRVEPPDLPLVEGPTTPEPAPGTPRVNLSGQIEMVGEDVIVVNGVRIQLGPGAEVPRDVETGARVRIDAERLPGGLLRALDVRVAVGIPAPAPTPEATPPAPTPPPTPPAPTPPPTSGPVRLTVEGMLDVDDAGRYRVDEVLVVIDDSQVLGHLRPYATVRVEGTEQPDGSVSAERIEVIAPPETVELEGVVDVVDDLVQIAGETVILDHTVPVIGDLVAGVTVVVHGVRGPGGVVIAERLEVLVPAPFPPAPTPDEQEPAPEPFSMVGEVRDLYIDEGSVWLVVEDMDLLVTSDTVMDGDLPIDDLLDDLLGDNGLLDDLPDDLLGNGGLSLDELLDDLLRDGGLSVDDLLSLLEGITLRIEGLRHPDGTAEALAITVLD